MAGGAGKSMNSNSSVQVPQEVLARYNSVNATAESAAATPFQQYSSNPSAFVAPLTATQQAGISNTNAASGQAQPYYQAGAGLTLAGAQAANPTQLTGQDINQYMSPYLGAVLGSTEALTNQQNQQAMAGQLGNAIQSGAFGGDRSGIAAANLSQQQMLAGGNLYAGIANQGYNNALGVAQQQQGVGLGAQQANLQRLSSAGAQLGGLGAGAQSAALQGATSQLAAGQQEQSTQQAGQTALYNQFLQQQAYPFQTAQFLANIAEGTGSLSGSTTQTTQPTGLFGNLLSDRRAKEDIKKVGKAKNGLNIYTFRYKGDPEKVTHLGFMADEVEKKHPEAVGLAGGLKTVDYDRAARADGGGLVFDPNAGQYGLGTAAMPGRGTYVPAPSQSAARKIVFQATPPAPKQGGLAAAADQYKEMKGLYDDGSQIWNDGKSLVSGLGSAASQYSKGGLALARDDGGPVDDPYQSDSELQHRERGLAASAKMQEQPPNDAGNGPVSGALGAQASQPKYTLNAPAAPKLSTSNDLQTLGQLGKLGMQAATLFLNQGGLVPREHHADGDIVGDDINPHGDAPVNDVMTPKEMYNTTASRPSNPDMSGMLGRGLPADAVDVPVPPRQHPGLSPATPAHVPSGSMSANGNVPVPHSRHAGLGIDPNAVAAQPDLSVPSGVPMSHYQMVGRQPTMVMDEPSGLGGGSDVSGLVAQAKALPAASATTGNAPLNIQNNNPGNLIDGDFAKSLQGYVGADKHGFAVFDSPQAGQAASERNLLAYAKHGINTPSAIINRWSPPNAPGNSPEATKNYINYVANRLGVDPNTPLDMSDPSVRAATAGAIKEFEGGLRPAGGDGSRAAGLKQIPPSGQDGGHQPGLYGSISGFLHGQPDGQTSTNGGMGERALMAVLGGLGAVGSYKGQSVLGAALQGLGAGAHSWMESGKQQADIARTQAGTGLTGAETNSVNVGAARNSVLDNGMVIGPDGRLHYINKDIAGQGVPLYGGNSNASTVQTQSQPQGSGVVLQVQKPELFGIGYNPEKAKNEILAGPQSAADISQSAAYQGAVKQAGDKANTDLGYSRRLTGELVHAYEQGGMNTPGSGFTSRAGAVGSLNTAARAAGLGEGFFGDADKGQALTEKINRLQAALTQQGAGDHTLGALEMFKGTNATLEQPPEASAEIATQLMADKMRMKDQWKHMERYKSDSPVGTVLGAGDDFNKNNPAEKYIKEADELKKLMLTKGISPYFDKLTSGKYTASVVAKSLQKHGYDPNLARYFADDGQ